MTAAVFELEATHTGREVSLNEGSYSVQLQGTAFGMPVRKPMYPQVYDAQRITVAGAPVDAREQQLRVQVTGASLVALQANLDELYRVCEDITRKGGGELRHTSTNGAAVTTYRVAFGQVGPPEMMGAEYEAGLRAVVTIALVVDPFGLGEAVAMQWAGKVFPRTLDYTGCGGTADALAAVDYTASSGVPSAMLLAWWPQVAAHNFLVDGTAEIAGSVAATAYSWTHAAEAGVLSAGTSVARTTTAGKFRSGSTGFEVVTPVTTDTGARHRMARLFESGVTYTASAWVKSSGGSTTPVRIKLGVSGDIAAGSSVALTTGWQQIAVSWTPSADRRESVFVAITTAAATATTFQLDDVMVYKGVVAPTFRSGGYGPGIIPALDRSPAAASINGSAWSLALDSDYLSGWNVVASGALSTNGNLEFPILPHLFEPDDYTSDEVDVAVFGRVELASTQTSLAVALSMAPDRGTSYGVRRYGNFRAAGKALTLPSSGTVFKPYYLGTVTLKVDRSKPRREWLRVAFTNSGAATGTIGLDYLVLVPVRCCARSRSGSSASIVPAFLTATGVTKLIRHDLSGAVIEADLLGETPEDGIGGEPLHFPPDPCEVLVWPSDQVVDLTDSSAASMGKTFTATVSVSAQPRVHLLRQS
jgi:Carbohydrate binding domain